MEINKKLSRIMFWGGCLILFLPIIVLPPSFQPSDWTRSILFRIIITTLVSFLLFKFFYKKSISIELPAWNKSLYPVRNLPSQSSLPHNSEQIVQSTATQKNSIFLRCKEFLSQISNGVYLPILILAVFFITLIIATIFSQDVSFSIFASPTRSGGVLNLLFFFIFSVLLAIFINKNQWEKLFRILFITGGMTSALAIVQYFNLLKNIFISFESGSTPSFLGNSTVLAMYMIFLSFLSFTFFIQKQDKKQKLLYGALFLLFVFTILISGSRAGYLGLLAGFLYFFLWYPYPKKYKTLKIIAASLLLLSILVVLLFNFFPQLGEKSNILKVITNRVSIKKIATDIVGIRLPAWNMTIKAIQDKPLLGWGPENFYIGFERYYDPTLFNHSVLLWDRPHNILLDIAASSGIFSLLLYLAFWVALFWKLSHAKNSQKKEDYYADNTIKIHGVQAMFIGYLIVLFFNFDSFATYVISFFFIGYSFYLISLSRLQNNRGSSYEFNKLNSSGQQEKVMLLPLQNTFFNKKPLVFICFTMVVMFLWFWNIKPLYLNGKIAYIKNLASQRHCKQAFNILDNDKWEKSGVIKPYAILLYSDIVKSCAFTEPEKEVEYSKQVVNLLKTAADAQPKFSRIWIFMGGFTNVLAAREENADSKKALIKEAIDQLQMAIQLSPGRQEAMAEMGKSYLIAQDYPAMKKVGQDCINIDSRFGECYFQLGLAQIFLGQQEDGKKNIDLAIANGYNYNPMYKQLAVAYMSQKNWPDAVLAYQKLRPSDEKSAAASYFATLAFLYDKAGDYEKAGLTALEVFKLQPDNPETLTFIKLLLGKRPNNPILNSSLGFIYFKPGPEQELSKAKAIYLQLFNNDPKNTEYLSYLILIHHQLKEYEMTYVRAVQLIQLNPPSKMGMEELIQSLPSEHGYWERYLKENPPK